MDAQGRARMVDVGGKDTTARQAVARGSVYMQDATLRAIVEQQVAKGDVLQVARIAGIMGTKQTPALIPMCHPLEITSVEVDLWPDAEGARVCIEARVRNMGRTGVEMEALTAVTVAGLTVYDMCKGLDPQMARADKEGAARNPAPTQWRRRGPCDRPQRRDVGRHLALHTALLRQ